MPRSRRLAEKIATGVSLAERGEVARLRLSDSQRRDLHAALDAMIDERDGSLTRPLLRLRSALPSTTASSLAFEPGRPRQRQPVTNSHCRLTRPRAGPGRGVPWHLRAKRTSLALAVVLVGATHL
jgi:hypothetical protein